MELELCWNAFGEVDNLKGGLGTAVSAQKNPDVLSLQGNVRFSRETIGYVPLRESKIVAPSEMFIVGDRPGFFVEIGRIGEGWRWRSYDIPRLFVSSSWEEDEHHVHGWACGVVACGAYLVANKKKGVPPLESNQRVDQKRFNAYPYRC